MLCNFLWQSIFCIFKQFYLHPFTQQLKQWDQCSMYMCKVAPHKSDLASQSTPWPSLVSCVTDHRLADSTTELTSSCLYLWGTGWVHIQSQLTEGYIHSMRKSLGNVPVQKCNREQYVTQESKWQPQALCTSALLPPTCTDILIPGSPYKISGRAPLKEGISHWYGIAKNQK